jgi:uncharacterized protein YkwD
MKPHRIFVAAIFFLGYLTPINVVHADALNVINTLRNKECPGHLPTTRPLKSSSKLSLAAKQVDDGLTVRDALKRADYRADKSSVIHIGGSVDDAILKRTLAKNYCGTLTDASLVDIGIFRTSRSIALVFAAPFAPPSPGEAPQVSKQVLQLVNQARAKPRRCGTKQFKAVTPVALNEQLRVAAIAHAKDMANRGVVTHMGADGSSPGDRVTRAGYTWKSVGENVAGGQLSAAEVVAGWLASPGHCVNIMDADFTQMAVAYVVNSNQEIGIYWAQEFGRPQ